MPRAAGCGIGLPSEKWREGERERETMKQMAGCGIGLRSNTQRESKSERGNRLVALSWTDFAGQAHPEGNKNTTDLHTTDLRMIRILSRSIYRKTADQPHQRPLCYIKCMWRSCQCGEAAGQGVGGGGVAPRKARGGEAPPETSAWSSIIIGVRGSPERGYFTPACVWSGRWAHLVSCLRVGACAFR